MGGTPLRSKRLVSAPRTLRLIERGVMDDSCWHCKPRVTSDACVSWHCKNQMVGWFWNSWKATWRTSHSIPSPNNWVLSPPLAVCRMLEITRVRKQMSTSALLTHITKSHASRRTDVKPPLMAASSSRFENAFASSQTSDPQRSSFSISQPSAASLNATDFSSARGMVWSSEKTGTTHCWPHKTLGIDAIRMRGWQVWDGEVTDALRTEMFLGTVGKVLLWVSDSLHCIVWEGLCSLWLAIALLRHWLLRSLGVFISGISMTLYINVDRCAYIDNIDQASGRYDILHVAIWSWFRFITGCVDVGNWIRCMMITRKLLIHPPWDAFVNPQRTVIEGCHYS